MLIRDFICRIMDRTLHCGVHIGLIFLLSSCREEVFEKKTRPVRAMEVVKEEVIDTRVFPGRTRAVDRVNLSFRVSGPLIERPVYVGDKVKKGQLLAKIDPRDFEVTIREVEGQLEKSKAKLRFADSDYERVQSIWKEDPGAISKSYLDQKLEERNQLRGEVQALEAQLDAAKDALIYTSINAPFDGIIVATYVQNYEYVNAKQSIIRLLDVNQIEMVIDVPDSLVIYAPLVDELTVKFDALPGKTFIATIKEIGTEASVTTRTYPVTLLIDQSKDLQILAGMAGEARVSKTSISPPKAVIIPSTSLFSDKKPDQTFVWVVDRESNTVKRREVKLGEVTTKGVDIVSGLETGEWVVTAGANYLQDGQQITILPVHLDRTGNQIEEGR